MTYAYRKQEPGQRYSPALPPRHLVRRSVLDETMLLVLGKLWYFDWFMQTHHSQTMPSVVTGGWRSRDVAKGTRR